MNPSTHAPSTAEHTRMYGGDVILSFDREDHKYFASSQEKDYGRAVSSTQVLDVLSKDGALQWWAVNETLDYIEEKWEPGQAYDEVEIDSILSDAKHARFKSSGKAKKIGSLVHDWIEDYVRSHVKGKSVTVIQPGQSEVNTDMVRDISLPYNDRAQESIEEFLEWTQLHDIQWIGAEQKAFSKKFGYAGTYDADAIIDGKRTLIDWKTSKDIYKEYPLQAAAYVFAREEESAWNKRKGHGDRVKYDRMSILRVPKTGGEFEIWSEDDRKEMLRLANVFQNLLQVQKWKASSDL